MLHISQNLLSNSTQWLRDTGVLAKLADDELNAPIPIPDPKLRTDQPISIQELGIAAAGYSTGMVLALFSFIWELCTSKKSRRVRTESSKPTSKSLREEEVGKKGRDLKLPMEHENVTKMRSQQKQTPFQHEVIIHHI